MAQCTRDFSRASGELQVIARNCDWFMEPFVPVVISRSNCFGFGFSTVIWKPLYSDQSPQQQIMESSRKDLRVLKSGMTLVMTQSFFLSNILRKTLS